MTAKSRNVFRIVVSIIFIVLGLASGIPALLNLIGNLTSIQFHTVWSLAFDAVMFFAGLLGFLKTNKQVCIILSFVIFIGFAVGAITAIIANAGIWDVAFAIAKAVIAWLYIGCIDSRRRR